MTTSQKAVLLRRLQRLDHEMRLRHYPSTWTDSEAELPTPEPRDAEQYFLAEQCPSDASFR